VTDTARPVFGGTRYLAAITAAVASVAVGVGLWNWRPGDDLTEPTEIERPLVAVRPFRSLSTDPQQAYLAAGMTDEIRGQLSQVSSLRVLSRDAVDAYKEGELSRMVRELAVRNVVDGTVRVDGNRVRISAELVDASTSETLWSDQYDRELADILAVPSEVAVQITGALRSKLTAHERQRVGSRPTSNLEAYRLYLQAQQMSPLSDRAVNVQAMELLRKAIALDPRFAVAQAVLAYRLVLLGSYDEPSYVDEGIKQAQEALRIDPSLAAGHFTLARAYDHKGLEAQSRQAYLRALELDPNFVPAMRNFSLHEAWYGRLDESLYWGRRGFELAGRSGNDYYHVAVPLLALRDDEATGKWLADAERRFPDFLRIQHMLALLDIVHDQPGKAAARTAALSARLPENEEVRFQRADVAFLTNSTDLEKAHEALMARAASNFVGVPESIRVRYAYALRKRDAARAESLLVEAGRIAREKMTRGDQTPALRIEMAAVATLRGDPASALDWLSRAYDTGYRDYGLLERDPIIRELGSSQRVKEIIDRMRVDVDGQRERARARDLLDVDSLLGPGT
jgi:TolB-like protein